MGCEGCKYIKQFGATCYCPGEYYCDLNHMDEFDNDAGCDCYEDKDAYTKYDYDEDHWDERHDR